MEFLKRKSLHYQAAVCTQNWSLVTYHFSNELRCIVEKDEGKIESMKKDLVSDDGSFCLESEEDETGLDRRDENESDSEYSEILDDNQSLNNQNSMQTTWPQSYRQSMDLYAFVPSPKVSFLATTPLAKLGGSFLLNRRHTPDKLPTFSEPFLPTVDDKLDAKQRRSSLSSLPPLPPKGSRRNSSMCDDLAVPRQCSYGQSVLNGINVLCGVGILSTPFAVKEGGFAGLAILLIFSVLSFYTGILLRNCLESKPGLATYPDIGEAAFGTAGRFAISIILYAELYSCCVEYIILESDNLSSLFPNAHLILGGIYLDSRHFFALLATLTILPTVWLKDLRVLTLISAGGVVASMSAVICLFWVGLVDKVGSESKGSTLNLSTLPVAIGLYGYCFAGHAVFPNIYMSMKNRNQYPTFLFTTFGICTLMYLGVAVMGYMMFGESTLSQFTLNMPKDLIASKIAVWTTVVNPFTKYALTMTPVAMSLEELIPSRHTKFPIYSMLIRTALVVSTLLVGLGIPFFGLVMSLVGSLFAMLISLILPSACYLSILKGKLNFLQVSFCILVIAIGMVASGIGTYSALSEIIKQF